MNSEYMQGLTKTERSMVSRFSEQCGITKALNSAEELKKTKTLGSLDIAVGDVLIAMQLFNQQTFDANMNVIMSNMLEDCVTRLSTAYQVVKARIRLTTQTKAKLQSIGIFK
jgi:hypothetical protein